MSGRRSPAWILLALGLVLSQAAPGSAQSQVAVQHRIRYASGNKINQVYWEPRPVRLETGKNGAVPADSVIDYGEKLMPLGEGNLKLRPRSFFHWPLKSLQRLHGKQVLQAASTDLRQHEFDIYEFDLEYRSVPVARASRTLIFKDGRPIAVRDRNYPQNIRKVSFAKQNVDLNVAQTLALQDAQEVFGMLYPNSAPMLTVESRGPEAPRLVIWNDADRDTPRLAWACRVYSVDRAHPFLRRYWVLAQDYARILDYEDLIIYQAHRLPGARVASANPGAYFLQRNPFRNQQAMLRNPIGGGLPIMPGRSPKAPAASLNQPGPVQTYPHEITFDGTVAGVVGGTIWENSPFGGIAVRGLPDVEVTAICPGRAPVSTRTDGGGQFVLHNVQGNARFQVALSGGACRIVNHMPPPADSAPLVLNVLDKNRVQVSFPAHYAEESKLAQTSAYYYVNQAYAFVQEFCPGHSKLRHLRTNVNINDSCNAYYDLKDGSLNFYRSGKDGCPNTAYRDVIFHEYGHAVDDEMGGVLDAAYSEGFGDALAVLMTRSPVVGRDFYGPPGSEKGGHLRVVDQVVYWSNVKDGEIHRAGLAYAGFAWELFQQLRARYGDDQAVIVGRQLILGAAAKNPKDIPDAVRLSFYVDSLLYPAAGGQGAPSLHYYQLKAAAHSRGLPTP